MIVWLDNGAFPPSAATKKAARAAGASMVISSPWPADYAHLDAGPQSVADPEVSPQGLTTPDDVYVALAERLGTTPERLRAVAEG